MRRLLACAGITVLGCHPLLPLPAASDSGTRFGVLTGFSRVEPRPRRTSPDAPRPLGLYPYGMFYASSAAPAQDDRVGLRLSAYLSTAANVGGEVYLEAPKSWMGAIDVGTGAVVQLGTQDAAGPLVSAGGRVGATGYLWGTQGFMVMGDSAGGGRHWTTSTMVGFRPQRESRSRLSMLLGAVYGPAQVQCGRGVLWCAAGAQFFAGVMVTSPVPPSRRRAPPWIRRRP